MNRLQRWLRRFPIGTPVSEPETTSYDPRLEHPEPQTTVFGAELYVGDEVLIEGLTFVVSEPGGPLDPDSIYPNALVRGKRK